MLLNIYFQSDITWFNMVLKPDVFLFLFCVFYIEFPIASSKCYLILLKISFTTLIFKTTDVNSSSKLKDPSKLWITPFIWTKYLFMIQEFSFFFLSDRLLNFFIYLNFFAITFCFVALSQDLWRFSAWILSHLQFLW